MITPQRQLEIAEQAGQEILRARNLLLPLIRKNLVGQFNDFRTRSKIPVHLLHSILMDYLRKINPAANAWLQLQLGLLPEADYYRLQERVEQILEGEDWIKATLALTELGFEYPVLMSNMFQGINQAFLGTEDLFEQHPDLREAVEARMVQIMAQEAGVSEEAMLTFLKDQGSFSN